MCPQVGLGIAELAPKPENTQMRRGRATPQRTSSRPRQGPVGAVLFLTRGGPGGGADRFRGVSLALRGPPCQAPVGLQSGLPAVRDPRCDIPSGCCSFTGPWTVTRSSLRMLRRVAAFCRPLRPVLLLVSFPRSRSPVVGVLGLC